MPTYEYRCKGCGDELEVVQSFHDDPLDTCPSCGDTLRKKFAAPGISFRGSGFYKTDSRGSSSSVTPATTGDSSDSKASANGSGDGGSGDGGSGNSSSSSSTDGGSKDSKAASNGSSSTPSSTKPSTSSGSKTATPA
ncbi:MAG: FmdB family zinc ribbon protein [Acidimicrobiales bacterium]